jgi:hypothetical protein
MPTFVRGAQGFCVHLPSYADRLPCMRLGISVMTRLVQNTIFPFVLSTVVTEMNGLDILPPSICLVLLRPVLLPFVNSRSLPCADCSTVKELIRRRRSLFYIACCRQTLLVYSITQQ